MAVEFDGADDYITMLSPSALDNIWDGGGTLAVWIYPHTSGEGGFGRIVDKGPYAAGPGWAFQVLDDGAGLINFQFNVDWDTGDGRWTWSLSNAVNTWYHIMLVYNADAAGNDPTLYVNGVDEVANIIENLTPSTTRQSDASGPWEFGNRSTDTARTFDGLMEDARVYTTSLTAHAAQVLAAGYRGPLGGEVGWWGMDTFKAVAHPDGTTLTVTTNLLPDKSANSNTGNPTNGPVARASDAPRYGVYF